MSAMRPMRRLVVVGRRWSRCVATADELAKVHGQSSELVKMVTELTAVIERIAKQVNDIAHTPVPAQTLLIRMGSPE